MRGQVGAVGVVASGAVLSGAASVAGLALATRALGPARAGPLAVAWALAVVVGPGLWSSVEQEAARARSAGEETAGLRRLVAARAALAAAAVAAAGLAGRHQLFDGSVGVPVALGVLAAAYGPLHLAWGRLAGERRSRVLATSVAMEGLARLVLVGGVALVTDDVGASAVALGVAVGVTAVLATAMVGAGGGEGGGTAGEPNGAADRIRWLTGAGLLSQGLFLSSPAAFELLAPSGDTRTTRLAMAVVLARAPALVWKGVLTAVVPAVAADPLATPRTSAAVGRAVLLGAGLAAVVGAAAAVAVGDPVLDLLTGPGRHLGAVALAMLGLATAAYLGALTATSALAGAGRARPAAAAWVAAVATSMAVAVLPGDALRRVVTAVAAGAVVALAATVAACVRRPPDAPAA